MSQEFLHYFYINLGIDETNETKLIKVSSVQKFEDRFSQYPAFDVLAERPFRKLLSSTNQIETIEERMKNICKKHCMQGYDMNHNGQLDDGFFILNNTSESNINAIADLLHIFYTDLEFKYLREEAEDLYSVFAKNGID